MSDRKQGYLVFATDGDKIVATYFDDVPVAGENSYPVLCGRSLDDCQKACGDLVLLMQHRNGILNFTEDGKVNPIATPSLQPKLQRIAATDKGKGWA